MLKNIAHVGVAVRDLDHSIALFTTLLGRAPEHLEEVVDQKVKTAMFNGAETKIELLQATGPDSPVAKFIEKRGEGMHHLSFEVDDIRAELRRLAEEGFELVDKDPRPGAGGYLVAFLHPKSTNSVLIELGQKVG